MLFLSSSYEKCLPKFSKETFKISNLQFSTRDLFFHMLKKNSWNNLTTFLRQPHLSYANISTLDSLCLFFLLKINRNISFIFFRPITMFSFPLMAYFFLGSSKNSASLKFKVLNTYSRFVIESVFFPCKRYFRFKFLVMLDMSCSYVNSY